MPTVPVYGQPRVQSAPLPGARLNPQAPNAAFAGAPPVDLSGVSHVLAGIVQEERQRANEVALVDADEQLGRFETSLLYDPEKGLLNRRGRDAFEVPELAKGEWEKKVGEIEAGLANDAQRSAFRRLTVQRGVDVDRTIQRHVSGEMRSYEEERTKSLLDVELNAALNAYQDPERVDMAATRITDAITNFARHNGLSAETRDAQVQGAVSSVYAGVVDRMLADGDDLAAKKYYESVKDKISGGDSVRTVKALELGSVRGESQRQADRISDAAPNLTAALVEARKLDDPDVRAATEDRLRQYYATKSQAKRQKEEEDEVRALNVIERTHDVHSIPHSLWDTFDGGTRSSLRSYARQLAEGLPVETNWQSYYDLLSFATSRDPKEHAAFMRTNLAGYRPKLGNRELEELTRLQAKMRAGGATADVALSGYQTTAGIVNGALNAIGIDPTPTPSDEPDSDAAKAALFRRRADEQIAEWKRVNGKEEIPTAEAQKIVDLLATDIAFNRHAWRDAHKPAFLVTPKDAERDSYVDMENIPPQDVASLTKRYKQAHGDQEPPRGVIERAYGAVVLGDAARALEILGVK